MKSLNKWVDVRKKQVKEVEDMDVTIQRVDDLNAYVTLKEVKKLTEPHYIYVNGEKIKKLDEHYTILEYTPLNKFYNVRVHINNKLEILEYYFDIIKENEIRDGIPFYNDLYLDVVYYQPASTKDGTFILLDDQNELKDALEKGTIDKEEYDFAYQVTDELMNELKQKENIFVNRGLKDYFKYRKNNW